MPKNDNATQLKTTLFIERIDKALAIEPEKTKENAHKLLRELLPYISSYTDDTSLVLMCCDGYDHIVKKYADKEFVEKIELSCTYAIFQNKDKSSMLQEILKKNPNFQPHQAPLLSFFNTIPDAKWNSPENQEKLAAAVARESRWGNLNQPLSKEHQALLNTFANVLNTPASTAATNTAAASAQSQSAAAAPAPS